MLFRSKFVEGVPDVGEGYAGALGRSDEGEAAQDVAVVAPLVSGRPDAEDETLAFVEVQGGRADTAALGNLADGQLVGGVQVRRGHRNIVLDLNPS